MAEDKKPEPKAEPKKLTVRLLADYWDSEGVRHSASYVGKDGEKYESGALIELPPEEARALVKTHAAERGDDY